MGLNPSNGIAGRAAEAAGRTPFRNLGDDADKIAADQVALESKTGGLDKLPDFVKSRRAWYYWVIRLEGRALPDEVSLAMFDKNGTDVRPFGHCAMDKKMLKEWLATGRDYNRRIREDNLNTDELYIRDKLKVKLEKKPEGVTDWHVDTVEGLKELVETLRGHFGTSETNPK